MKLRSALLALFLAIAGGAIAATDEAEKATPAKGRPIDRSSAAPLSMIGWQFHEYSIPKLEEAVRKAPEYGVNFLIFSHGFFWSTEGFLASDDALDPKHLPSYLDDIKLGDETNSSAAGRPICAISAIWRRRKTFRITSGFMNSTMYQSGS